MVREITKQFFDRMDIAMGGQGLGNIAEKRKPGAYGDKEKRASQYKMEELVDVYGKWKKHFALQEGMERTKIRDRARLFRPYLLWINMYKDTHKIKDWPKDIEEVIRDANLYKIQNNVLVTYETEKDGYNDPIAALAKAHVEKMWQRKGSEKQFSSNEIDAKLTPGQLRGIEMIDQWLLRNYNNGGIVGTVITVKNHNGEMVRELLSKTKRERLFIY